jgi:N-acyl-D-aspartate/D-glutamate deacylase
MGRFLLAGVLVFDGTGTKGRVADVRVDGPYIEQVAAPGSVPKGVPVVSGEGLALCPGFIDVHSHADRSPFSPHLDTTKVLQGITTEVVGNCGSSPLGGGHEDRSRGRPSDYLAALDAARPVTNFAPLVGHGSLRERVMGFENRGCTPDEIGGMRALLIEALDRGAFGLSSGLFYTPGSYADTDELSRLLEGLSTRPLVYASHIRNEGNALLPAVDEFLAVGRATGVRLELSHHKAAGIPNWGKTRESLDRVRAARQRGVSVALDAYPYTASSTSISANLPGWVLEGGRDRAMARLADADTRRRIAAECESGETEWESMIFATGYDRMVIAFTKTGQHHGKTLAALATERGTTPFDAMADLLLENEMTAGMVVHSMHADDLTRVLSDPECWIGTDGVAGDAASRPHPRLTGTFPRVFREFVRERGLYSWEEAVRRMTGGPAEYFHIPERGFIREGQVADLVLFDPDRIADASTFEEPWTPPHGITAIYMGGVKVAEGTRFLGSPEGRRLTPAAL